MGENEIILFILSILWIIPIFRQRGGQYFHFFIVLSYSAPLALLAVSVFNLNAAFILTIASYLLFMSIQPKKERTAKWFQNSMAALVPFGLGFFFSDYSISLLLLNFMILWKIQKISVICYLNTNSINLFYIVLIVHQVSLIIFYVINISGSEYAILFSYLTLIVDFLAVLFLSKYRENDSAILVKLSYSP